MKKAILLLTLSIVFIGFNSCNKKDKDDWTDYINIFTLQDDIAFGEQLDSSIMADPVQFPILDKDANPEAYAYLEGMMYHILTSGEIAHLNDFEWQIRIIDSPVFNAFAAPGGKLYFYTGIIDYLDNAAQLAGVLAHEIAHSDRRHSSQQMTKAYGVPVLLGLLLGENSETSFGQIATQLATGVASLKFSREDEYEADEFSVKYLADIEALKNYHPTGIAGFFEKLEADGYTNDSFEFLSTHPTDENRVDNIIAVWEELGSPDGETFISEYENFKILLGLK